jgi:transcriptional regulator of acetoin/glycerol metabolism
MTAPHPSLFAASRTERIALARRRYFEEGLPPSGVVSDAVFQSWARCQRLHATPEAKVAFEPVSTSRTHLALQKNRALHDAWLQEIPQFQAVLGTTSCAAMLTDGSGVLIAATCVGRAHERLMPIATRLGVNLAEEAVGTTAPGVAARTGQAVVVYAAEHFFDDVKSMHCAAAPIRDVHGRLAGLLDISSETLPFRFDAAGVVGLYAGAIENRLLVAQSREHLVLRFQVDPSLLDSPAAALVGIDTQGLLAWRNGAASRLLGMPMPMPMPMPDTPALHVDADVALGATLPQLVRLCGKGTTALHLPNGLMVWARAELQAPDGAHGVHALGAAGAPVATVAPLSPLAPLAPLAPLDPLASAALPAALQPDAPQPEAPQAASAPHAARLRDADRSLIAQTLQVCGGNVSAAAKALGVSRGLIYRRLREGQGAT